MRAALLFSDGSYGPLVTLDEAQRAHDGIDLERRHLVRITRWVEVTDENADTMPPAADPNCPHRWSLNFATGRGSCFYCKTEAPPEATKRMCDAFLSGLRDGARAVLGEDPFSEAKIRAEMVTETEEK